MIHPPRMHISLKNKRTRGLNPKNRRGVKPSDWFSKRKWNSGRVDCILGMVFGCLIAFWAGLIDPPAQNSIFQHERSYSLKNVWGFSISRVLRLKHGILEDQEHSGRTIPIPRVNMWESTAVWAGSGIL